MDWNFRQRSFLLVNAFSIQIMDKGEKQNPLLFALQPQYFVGMTRPQMESVYGF